MPKRNLIGSAAFLYPSLPPAILNSAQRWMGQTVYYLLLNSEGANVFVTPIAHRLWGKVSRSSQSAITPILVDVIQKFTM